MKLEGVIHCEGSKCEAHQHVGVANMNAGRLPVGWIRVVEYGDAGPIESAYHGWDCVLKTAASVPPSEVIPIDVKPGPVDDD